MLKQSQAQRDNCLFRPPVRIKYLHVVPAVVVVAVQGMSSDPFPADIKLLTRRGDRSNSLAAGCRTLPWTAGFAPPLVTVAIPLPPAADMVEWLYCTPIITIICTPARTQSWSVVAAWAWEWAWRGMT